MMDYIIVAAVVAFFFAIGRDKKTETFVGKFVETFLVGIFLVGIATAVIYPFF